MDEQDVSEAYEKAPMEYAKLIGVNTEYFNASVYFHCSLRFKQTKFFVALPKEEKVKIEFCEFPKESRYPYANQKLTAFSIQMSGTNAAYSQLLDKLTMQATLFLISIKELQGNINANKGQWQ